EHGRVLTDARRAGARAAAAASLQSNALLEPIRPGEITTMIVVRAAWPLVACAGLSLTPLCAPAAEPAECPPGRVVDIGWTDITATTSLTTVVRQGLGYKPTTTIASVPI